MNRWQMITKNDDDEVWGIVDRVVEREWLEDGQIRWVIETEAPVETIMEVVPSVVSVTSGEPEDEEESGEPLEE